MFHMVTSNVPSLMQKLMHYFHIWYSCVPYTFVQYVKRNGPVPYMGRCSTVPHMAHCSLFHTWHSVPLFHTCDSVRFMQGTVFSYMCWRQCSVSLYGTVVFHKKCSSFTHWIVSQISNQQCSRGLCFLHEATWIAWMGQFQMYTWDISSR